MNQPSCAPKGTGDVRLNMRSKRWGRDIYGEDVAPQVHQESASAAHARLAAGSLALPRMYAPFATKPAERILLAYLCDPDVYQNGQRPVQTRNQDERGFLLDAQRMLRAAFHTRQITVEANPAATRLSATSASWRSFPSSSSPNRGRMNQIYPSPLLMTTPDLRHVSASGVCVRLFRALLELGCTQQEALD